METKYKAIVKCAILATENKCGGWGYGNNIEQAANGTMLMEGTPIFAITLCKYSGFQDCKGNDIYQEDFLKLVEDVSIPYVYGAVRYEDGVFFVSDGENNDNRTPLSQMINDFGWKFEVVGNGWDILGQPRSAMSIANEKEFNKWVEESRADVLTEPVNGENFTVGETVIYTNGYGAKFKVKILGFCAEPQVVGSEFRTVYLDTYNPRFNYPYDAKSLTKIY